MNKDLEKELKIFDAKEQLVRENPNISQKVLNESIQEILEFYEKEPENYNLDGNDKEAYFINF